ncbi:MAG: OmpA family protein [candidate division Zixibacteria bacterium]|nr:OmpA family protein [candidate division Zixibacteria bacterium]
MKITISACWVLFLLLGVAVAFSQTPPGVTDSSRPVPSPLKIPDESPSDAENLSVSIDTMKTRPDTVTAIRDSVPSQPTPSPAQPVPQASAGDSDADGIADSVDHCPNTPHGLGVDKTGCLVMTELQRRLVLHVTYFPGTTRPDPYTLSILDDLSIRLMDSQKVTGVIEGFTDNIGEDSANLIVSQKRADKIKAYLVTRGVSAARLQAIGRGESKFVADNNTASGRRKNRRIEITFHQLE